MGHAQRALGMLTLLIACGTPPGDETSTATDTTSATPPAQATPLAASPATVATGPTGELAAVPAEEPPVAEQPSAEPLELPDPFVAPPWPELATPLHKAVIVGTWVPSEPEGFAHAWIDEPGTVQAFTKWKAGRREWRGVASRAGEIGVDHMLRDREGPAVGYLLSLVQRRPEDPTSWEVPEDRLAVLHVRHRGRIAAWFDGRPVIDAPAPPTGEWGLVQVPVALTHAYDVLLLKLGRGSDELGSSMDVEVRLSDLSGAALEGQDWNTMRSSELPSDLDALGIVQGQR